jgi:signal transduction histidine kinase
MARILIAEDSPETRALVRVLLEADGHEVDAVSDARAAVATACETKPDLILMDLSLPDLSGWDAARQIRSDPASAAIPILAVITAAMKGDCERALAAGCDGFIVEPIDEESFAARVLGFLERPTARAARPTSTLARRRERSAACVEREELDRLKSEFLSTVSHELRTPLNTIILLTHQLTRTPAPGRASELNDRDVRLLRGAAESLRQMIDNILDLAKLEAGQRDLHLEGVSLREFLEESANLLEPRAREKGLELSVEVDPATPTAFRIDREKVSTVLVNLLSNAVAYTTRGRVVLAARPSEKSIIVEVRDTGAGISPDLAGRAFEPFRSIRVRAGDSSRGAGLGLSISRQLVELMGGNLKLESREGGGTTVSFTLPPLHPPDSGGGVPEAATPALPVAGRRPRVLVVEDDESSRYALGALLESEGYDVAAADDLGAADEALWCGGCDAIVLDITLPDGDGAAWLSRRERLAIPTPPVIALTGVASDVDTRRVLEAGVRRVLSKPVNVTRLLLGLREILVASGRPAGKHSEENRAT